MPLLTQQAHAAVAEVLQQGDTAIDATAGNGHDTEFLSRCVGANGHVYAIDIQRQALDNTAQRLKRNARHNVVLLEANHADLRQLLPLEKHGSVATVMFNLGYLPGGDKQLITGPETSIRAIQDALLVLRSGGLLTIIAYPGHPGGATEVAAVRHLCDTLPANTTVRQTCGAARDTGRATPLLFVLRKM